MALAGIGLDARDEVSVDLHIVDRLVAEQLQPVEAGAEIVNRQLETGKPEITHEGREIRHLAAIEALGKLETE